MQRTPHNSNVTLIFTPSDPWSRSTTYCIKVPAGVSSIYQEILAKDSIFEFSTPTIQALQPCPVNNIHLPLPTNCILMIKFDQAIDTEEVLKTIKFRVGGLKTGSLVPVYMPARVVKEYDNQFKMLAAQHEGKCIVFTPLRPFPNNEEVTVTVGPGIPSAEGPLKSAEKYQFAFVTVQKFVVMNCLPQTPDKRVLIGTPLSIIFSTPIDPLSFDPEKMIKIEPPILGCSILVSEGLEIGLVKQKKLNQFLLLH